MTRDTAVARLRRTPSASEKVREVAVPHAARALSRLSHIDYEDAFRARIGLARARTSEEWARAMLEGAPLAVRNSLSRGWSVLGLNLGSTSSERLVLGWEIGASTEDWALLVARSIRFGFSAELLFKREQQTLQFCTFVQYRGLLARVLWAGLGPPHRRVVHGLLVHATRDLQH